MILYTYGTGVLIIHLVKFIWNTYHITRASGGKKSLTKRVLGFILEATVTALMVVVLLYSFAFFSFIGLAEQCVHRGYGTPSQCANNMLGDIVRAPLTVLMHE